MSSDPNSVAQALVNVRSIPKDQDGPIFREPWEAQAFAMAVSLHRSGAFSWTEWAAALSEEIAAAGPDDPAENYYLHWLAALEKMTHTKGIIDEAERFERKSAWERAARATPHGEPIELSNALTGR